MTPPMGSRGLPFTLVFADEYDDTVSDATRLALFDETLWTAAPTGSGTVLNPAPQVPTTTTLTTYPAVATATTVNPRASGLRLTSTPPRLNISLGTLEKGQIVQDVSRSYHSASALRASVPLAGVSISEAGRFTAHPSRRYSSGRPANHTWEQEHPDNRLSTSIDRTIGSAIADGTADCSDDTYTGGSRVEAITHYASADLPSNGFGVEWGDAHDATFLTTLQSSAVATGSTIPYLDLKVDSHTMSAHWSMNLGVRQRVLASGCAISAPNGIPITAASGEDAASRSLLLPDETIQQIFVSDSFSDGTAPTTSQTPSTLGRVDLGNHTVADSCGLIGYEGVITASAFFNISNDTDPSQTQGPITVSGTAMTYAGLNIQVHSGSTLRRNGYATAESTEPVFLYSDGTPADVMTDGLKTAGARSGGTFNANIDANLTAFQTRCRTHISTAAIDSPAGDPDQGTKPCASSPTLNRNRMEVADRLIGSTSESGSAWNPANFSTGWLKDGIPTKVQIIPSLLGHKVETVEGLPFKRPIVDYHILVSVVNKADVPDRKADTTVGTTNIGTPTNRNDPNSNRLHLDADYSDLPCTIYHGIVRIEPDTLTRITTDPTLAAAAGLDATDPTCNNSIIPKHTNMDVNGRAAMGWGLHQITPFRPIANRSWPRVPKMCAAIEGGGFYQRGGISHLFDADAYGGELFVAADIIDATDLAVQSTGSDGQPEFGVWGRGQITSDGSATPGMPTGSELMIFRYNPRTDPFHPGKKRTSRSDNPLRSAFGATVIEADNAFSSAIENLVLTDTDLLVGGNWEIHDWVFPQIELMRYLGREEKFSRMHPKHSLSTGDPVYHPTLHASSLRIMEDGRMMLAAVHVDYIKTESDYPSSEIRYPLNPDLDIGGCPPGYYLSGNQCVPIGSEQADLPVGTTPDPQSGDQIPGDAPSPVNGSGTSTPSSENFSEYPTWSKIKANTRARSLILMFTNAKANPQGLVARGSADFSITWEKVAIDEAGGTELLATQTWTTPDTWWSGSRISYWFDESGQRAIPITYGSYPDCRMSHAHLPRCLPRLTAEGYPLLQPIASVDQAEYQSRRTVPFDPWWIERQSHLVLTRFVPTTIGFADFGAGANPHQELGWSGWSFPKGLYDPASYGDNSIFFSDAPEAEQQPAGTAISPTEQAKWKGFGDNQDEASSPYSELGTKANAHTIDLSGVSFPTTLDAVNIERVPAGSPVNDVLLAPQAVGSIGEIISIMTDPAQCGYAPLEGEYLAVALSALKEDPTGTLVRTWVGSGATAQPLIENQDDPNGYIHFESITIGGVVYPFTTVNSFSGKRLMSGPMGGWSHHGPLHYGISSSMHPYRVDRVFKQVHGGVGYDAPLHLLIPPAVHVRARAGGRNSLDLEMETPFHRTDNQHLLGAAQFNTGFELGGESPPGSSRAAAGQFYLRTNLWDKPKWFDAYAKTTGLTGRIHGPLVSGSVGLEAFWSDHPTEHFHAGAIPLMPGTDYDLAMIESSRYAPMMLGNIKEMSELDALAVSENLLSSVDVHVSQSARPVWDSGAIVSAQGLGTNDATMSKFRISNEYATDDGGLTGPSTMAGTANRGGMGHGQRILRTPDGTLHIFHLRRSAQSGSQNYPIWTHMKKPLHGDLFFNSKAMKPDPDSSAYDGKDECGPLLHAIGANAGGSDNTVGRVYGAAYASDSNGTIHAVIEYHANPDGSASQRSHRLYYTKADRITVSTNPEPVYDWDWSIHTPVLINSNATGSDGGGSINDCRQPSLVCDSADRLHLTFSQQASVGSPAQSNIFYTCKLPNEDSFAPFTPTSARETGDSAYQVVNGIITDPSQTTLNQASAGPHYTTYNEYPKVMLRGDDTPVITYLGAPISGFTSTRTNSAVYVNIGQSPSGGNDPSGRFVFDTTKCYHVSGVGPDSRNTLDTSEPVSEYDALVDERDRVVVLSLKNDRQSAGSPSRSFARRQTLLTVFDARKSLSSQYTATNGLGDTRTLFILPKYDGTTETRALDTFYRGPQITTNGKGEYHIIMGFVGAAFGVSGASDQMGATFRDTAQQVESAIGPLQWPATPTGDLTGASETPYIGGFKAPSEAPRWPQLIEPPYPWYADSFGLMRHLLHAWLPSIEFDDDSSATDRVIRSVNIRWLSVPSLRYDSSISSWVPVGSAQTLAGEEDFPHFGQQMRYQRYWGFDASEIDLRWATNELSWFRTPHAGSRLFFPGGGGVQMTPGEGIGTGEGIPGYPDGA